MSRPGLAERLRAAFLGDLEEQLAKLNGSLLALELDPSNGDALNAVFRVMHTLKGAAHATDQQLVARACHGLETMLAEAREGLRKLGPDEFALLFSSTDALADAASRLAAGEELDDATLLGQLVARMEGTGEAPPAVETVPVATPVAIEAAAPSVAGDSSVRVAAEKLDALLSQVGRLLAARARIGEHASGTAAIAEAVAGAHAAVRRLLSGHSALLPPQVADSLRDVERTLRDASTAVSAAAAHGIDDGRELADVGDALAESVRRVRMLPFASACEPLPRLVRDVATETGKPTRLLVHGGGVEADRPILEALKDSLLHLTRNAIDHGVEPPSERALRGKPATATIAVSAALQGERLTVTLTDDGAGLDIPAIRRRLAELGRPVPDSDHDVARSLFQAGFSTRAVANAISGRGVGLDAVEAAMLRVRGSVTVTWSEGQGTTFTLQCPLTLAAIRAVLVRSGTQLLALPTSNVEQLVRVRASEVRRAEGREVILTGGVPIPLVALATVLGPPFVAPPQSDIFPALVVSAGDRRVALLVEAVETEQELVVRPIARGQSPMPHLSGGALLGSGQLALVLNPVSLIQQALVERGGTAVTDAPRKRRRVLVADDSLTTRALEQSVLEAAGYEVITAVDGADAWRQLQEAEVDLLVSDIEMPNMDGLTLCRTVRASERLANLPVVLVTSLDSPEARERGLAAGADAYVGKGAEGQAGLLGTVRELLA